MRILDRYILRSHIVPVSYCLIAFSAIFIVFDLFGRFSKFTAAAAPAPLVARYYLCTLLPTLEHIVPASLLLGTLYTLWHFSRSNELTAMRAIGVSLFRVMGPLLCVGTAFSLLTGAVKEFASPAAGIWAKGFSENGYQPRQETIFRNLAYFNASGLRQWMIDSVDLQNPTVLIRPSITHERPDGTREAEYRAERAQWLDGAWWLTGATCQEYDAADNPVGRPRPLTGDPERAVEMRALSETPEDFVIQAREWEDLSGLQMWRYLQTHPRLSTERRTQMTVDLHSRMAIPWAGLIVTLFAIPAGARGGRHSALTGVFVAVAFFFGFYATSQVGLFMGKRAMLSPWIGAWLSNILFFVAGCGMLAKLR